MNTKLSVLKNGNRVLKNGTDRKMFLSHKLAEYMLKHGAKTVLKKEDIAQVLSDLQGGKEVTEANLRCYVCIGREYAESKHGKTFWNIRGVGWRVADEQEKAIYTVRCARSTIKWADRTRRIYAVTQKSLVPGAMKKVFGSNEAGQAKIEDYNEKFRQLFLGKRGQLEN